VSRKLYLMGRPEQGASGAPPKDADLFLPATVFREALL
jgi:hypothetical protein